MLEKTPRELGYRWPAEWETHTATWLSWPHNRNSWPGKFEPVPPVFAEFARTIARFEPVHILAAGEALTEAERLTGGCPGIQLHDKQTNDCWIRDHGPWFLQHPELPPALVDWEYNAWGGKYPPFEADNAVPKFIADTLGMQRFSTRIVMEGGSVENNGAGVLLVTSQCLRNPNRNPDLSQAEIEQWLCDYTGAEKVLWLFSPDEGSIPGDDTDAHIDQIARFVDARTILACANSPEQAPFRCLPLLDKLHEQLLQLTDLNGEKFRIIPLPLPEPVFYDDQQLPTSYANYYIGNGFLIYPRFGCKQDQQAEELFRELYPAREIIGIGAVDFVWGLGAFHCASMQQGLAGTDPQV